jgi:hydrogenase maturation protease
MTGPVVIGVGNPYRRDDGAGPAVLAALRRDPVPGVRLVDSDGEPGRLIAAWEGTPLAVVVDAATGDPPRPGRIHRFTALRRIGGSAATSHSVDLGDAVALARVLGLMPNRLVLFTVEPADTGFGTDLSAPVTAAVRRLDQRIRAELAAGTDGRDQQHGGG